MTSPTPTLGYPTRTAAVQALRAQGLSTSAIASRIGIETKSVTALEASARKTQGGPSRGARRNYQPQGLIVDAEVRRALRPHAAKRSTTVDALIGRLLAILTDDDLVDALLDDVGEVSA